MENSLEEEFFYYMFDDMDKYEFDYDGLPIN